MGNPVYKRVLIKLSGEALAPKNREKGILDFDFMETIAEVIKKCTADGVQVAVLCGAGNIWRGAKGVNMDRNRADHMGMLGTTINALALQDTFLRCGLDAVVMTAVEMKAFADYYSSREADNALNAGKVVIFGCGLGSPFFTTDTAAALRAAEIHADAILMAKNIDYLYDKDPSKNPDAKPIYDITFEEIIERNLRAFDITAISMCKDNNIEAYGFALKNPDNIYKAVMGENAGTRMHN